MEFPGFLSKKYFVTRLFSYVQYETKMYNFLILRDVGESFVKKKLLRSPFWQICYINYIFLLGYFPLIIFSNFLVKFFFSNLEYLQVTEIYWNFIDVKLFERCIRR